MDMERGEEDLVGASGWCPAPPTCPAVGLGANDIISYASQVITHYLLLPIELGTSACRCILFSP